VVCAGGDGNGRRTDYSPVALLSCSDSKRPANNPLNVRWLYSRGQLKRTADRGRAADLNDPHVIRASSECDDPPGSHWPCCCAVVQAGQENVIGSANDHIDAIGQRPDRIVGQLDVGEHFDVRAGAQVLGHITSTDEHGTRTKRNGTPGMHGASDNSTYPGSHRRHHRDITGYFARCSNSEGGLR
jgi:hypothetical protein